MDGLDLVLSKWDNMNNLQKAIVASLILGAIAAALDHTFNFILKWIFPLSQLSISFISVNLLIYPILIIIFTFIIIKATQRERDRVNTILANERDRYKIEIAQWKKDCQWLWDRNETLQKLVDEFAPPSKPKVLTLDASMLLEPTTPEEAKRGEINNRLKN